MTVPLADRVPESVTLPRAPLCDLPTPVDHEPGLAADLGVDDLYVKRDDATASLYGGNKVRKLEFLLADAERQGLDDVWTIGSLGSNHVLATSLYAREVGLEPHAIQYPEPVDDHVRDNLRALSTARPDLELYDGEYRGFAAGLKRKLYRRLHPSPGYYYVPSGGALPVGELGYVNAALELRMQIEAGDHPEPDAIFVPVGSAGTLSGLAVGCRLAGLDAELVGVRTAMKPFGNAWRVAHLANRTGSVLAAFGVDAPRVSRRDVTVRHDHVGDGYGQPTSASRRAAEIAADHGLELDQTFTAKTVAAILEADVRRQFDAETVLYWHTLSSADLSDRVADADVTRDLPAAYQQFFE